MSEINLTEAAIQLAKDGLAIFPCGKDKKPLTPHGFKNASKNEPTIRGWWTRWPDAGIGMPTGKTNGFVVLDIDMDSGRGLNGEAAFRSLLNRYDAESPTTRTVRTPRGGRHLYFKHPGRPIKNSTSKIGPGLDIKADGGYVIAPPSRNVNGQSYEVKVEWPIADLPAWLEKLIVEPVRNQAPPPAQRVDDSPDRAKVEDALRWISANCPFDDWLRIGMALHSWSPTKGRALWNSWSRTAQKRYQETAIDQHWKTFKPGAVTIATMFKQAIDAGWKAQDRRSITSPQNGIRGGRPSAPPASQVAYAFADAKLRDPTRFLMVRHYRDTWHRFADGWRPVTELEMEKTVITFLQDNPALAPFATSNYARNILRNLASFNLCGLDARIEMPCWLSTGEDARNWIAFSNGVAVNVWDYATQLAEGRTPENHTRPVSPDLFSADFVSYPWNDAVIPDKFIKYLERVQPDAEGFNAVRRMLGLLIADVQKYEVFFQLHGNGANGKTVLLDVLEAAVGQSNVCRMPLESLAPGTRFQTWPLAASKVNVCGEIATDVGHGALAAIEGAFKHCVSGGVIEVEHKGRDKSTARCRARFVMSGNALPTFIDRSNAIWRRLRIIPFSVDLPLEEQDSDLAKKIISTEMSAICVWALDGLAEIIRAGRVDEYPAGLRLSEKHRMDCDHERQFFTDKFEVGGDEDRLPSTDLYDNYKTWMGDNGYRPLGAGKFFTRIEAVFPRSEAKLLRIDGEPKRGVIGLKWKM